MNEVLQRAIARIKRGIEMAVKANDEKAVEEFKVLLEVTEKQMPKKPIENFYDEQDGDDWYDEGYTYQCPLCEESEVGRYSKEMCEWVYQMAHCEKCGQAIDWGDDNKSWGKQL